MTRKKSKPNELNTGLQQKELVEMLLLCSALPPKVASFAIATHTLRRRRLNPQVNLK